MNPLVTRRFLARTFLAIAALAPAIGAGSAEAGSRRGSTPADPSRAVPLERLKPEHRESVAEVLRDPTLHRQGEADTFACHPNVYLSLLNEPALTLALWKDLSPAPARLRQVGPDRYQGEDGAGTTATWNFVLRSPKLHVILIDLEYVGPRGNLRLNGRIVLVVRSGYFQQGGDETYVRHDIEAFVKVDSRGWRAAARTARPVIEKVLEDQVREGGLCISIMGKLVETHPDWAVGVSGRQAHVPAETRRIFQEVVARSRRPGASTGRPAPEDVVSQVAGR